MTDASTEEMGKIAVNLIREYKDSYANVDLHRQLLNQWGRVYNYLVHEQPLVTHLTCGRSNADEHGHTDGCDHEIEANEDRDRSQALKLWRDAERNLRTSFNEAECRVRNSLRDIRSSFRSLTL